MPNLSAVVKSDWTVVSPDDAQGGVTLSVFSADKTVEYFRESQERKNSTTAKKMRQALRDELAQTE